MSDTTVTVSVRGAERHHPRPAPASCRAWHVLSRVGAVSRHRGDPIRSVTVQTGEDSAGPGARLPGAPVPGARARRRDRHGRGLRGRLVPPGVPLYRSRAQQFDDLVLEAVARLEPRWEAELSDVEFAVQEVPDGDTADEDGVPLARIGWFFLKVGAVLYGGGYVLFAFIEQGLVRDHHWLTQQQLLDAIAIGQFTPGPLLSTATFIGYLLGGAWGAAVATIAIFLPSFIYVAALGPILPKLRRSAWMAAFLDSVNVCAVSLMAGVSIKLAGDALRGWPMWVIAVASFAVLWKWKINPAWVVLGGALAGLGLAAVR